MNRLESLEIRLAVVVTVLVIALHWHCVACLGPLWRDEVNSVEIARLPSLHDVWTNLQYDSFPIVWHCVLRAWLKLGLVSDAQLRLFGFLMGVGTILALWCNARIFKQTSPLLALVLLGMNPTVIRWGDTVRGQGLGLLLFIGIPGGIWLLVTNPSSRNFFIALSLCLLAIHTQYYNAVLLFAVCIAGMIVAYVCGFHRRAVLVGALGFLCAVSLLVYVPAIKQAGTWNMLVQVPGFTFSKFLYKLSLSIGPIWGNFDAYIWAMLSFLACLTAILAQFHRSSKGGAREDVQLFFLIGLLIAFAGYFFFLRILSYETLTWYYINLMGFIALTVDGILAASRHRAWANARLAISIALIGLWFPGAWINVQGRLTDGDQVAKIIETSAGHDDLVVFGPWEPSLTFQYYYTGDTPWTTIPPLSFHKFHRYDEVKEAMILPNPAEAIAPVTDRISAVLKSGGQVWLVCETRFVPRATEPVSMPPAPQGPEGWRASVYSDMWLENTCYFCRIHASNAHLLTIRNLTSIIECEDSQIIVYSGWRE